MMIAKYAAQSTAQSAAQSTVSRRAMLTAIGSVAIAGASVIGGATGAVASGAQSTAIGDAVTLYKSPQCDCCEGYASYLRDNGFAVTTIATNDLTQMGEKYGISDALQPCHLSLVAGYVVGGHIPFDVIKRLLAEKPQIAGITLPGMPTGSPGMGGTKTGPMTIYEIAKGAPKVYAVA
jgi:hypothetical protein